MNTKKYIIQLNIYKKKYEEVIDRNREIPSNDNNEEEKKDNDINRTSYNNNGFINTLEIECNKLNYLEDVLKGKKKINQFFEKKVNEKDLKVDNLHGLIKEEKKLYNELRRNLMNLEEKK